MERAYSDARAFGWSREPIVEMLIPSTRRRPPGAAGRACREPVLPAVRVRAARGPALGRRARRGGRDDHRHGDRASRRTSGAASSAAWCCRRSTSSASFGLVGGDIMHGAHVARSAVGRAADARPRRLPCAGAQPVPVRGRHASGRRRVRHARAQRRAGNAARPQRRRGAEAGLVGPLVSEGKRAPCGALQGVGACGARFRSGLHALAVLVRAGVDLDLVAGLRRTAAPRSRSRWRAWRASAPCPRCRP